jgi:plastocyanin
MKRKGLICLITILIGIFYLTGLTFAAEKKAEEIKVINKIITISEYEGAKPATLTSKVGTTVVWVNHSRSPLEILFTDKKVVLACGSPVNFFIGKDGAYESAKIPFGGTASLCFTEKGKFDYIVKVSRTFYPMGDIERDHRGIIWIK